MRVALVTGASRGIGRACAEALGAAGLAVAVGYRTDDVGAKEVVEAIAHAGGRAEAVGIDVTDERQVDEAFERIEESLGPVAVLVNNAGMSRDGLALRYSTETFEETLATNLTGAFLCARRALAGMLDARWGRIVNVSSAAALRGNPGQVAYASSKAGLLGMTRSLAREVGKRGITVNAVCPGLIETDMAAAVTEEGRASLVEATPVGRPGTAEEVAAVIRFLASDEASYVHGAVVPVDGGMTA